MPTASAPRRRQKEQLGALTEAGRFLSERRLALGLTQSALADLADVGVSTVRALEAGKTTVTLGVILRVLDALGLAAAVGPQPALRVVTEAVVIIPADGVR